MSNFSKNLDLKKIQKLLKILSTSEPDRAKKMDELLKTCSEQEKKYFFNTERRGGNLTYKYPIYYAVSLDDVKLVDIFVSHMGASVFVPNNFFQFEEEDRVNMISKSDHGGKSWSAKLAFDSSIIIKIVNKYHCKKIFKKYQHDIFTQIINEKFDSSQQDKNSLFLKHLTIYLEESKSNFRIDFLKDMFKSIEKVYYFDYNQAIEEHCLLPTPDEHHFRDWLKRNILKNHDLPILNNYFQLINLTDDLCWPKEWQELDLRYLETVHKDNMLIAYVHHFVDKILEEQKYSLYPVLKKLQNTVIWKDYLNYLDQSILRVKNPTPELYAYLEKNNFDFKQFDNAENNALHHLVHNWKFQFFQSLSFLVKKPELWDRPNNEGKTPLNILKENIDEMNKNNMFLFARDTQYFDNDQAKVVINESISAIEKAIFQHNNTKKKKFTKIML